MGLGLGLVAKGFGVGLGLECLGLGLGLECLGLGLEALSLESKSDAFSNKISAPCKSRCFHRPIRCIDHYLDFTK